MIVVVINMVRAKYFFTMDKNLLRGCMEDLTYMYCPSDDMNRDRIIAMIGPSDDEDDEDEINEPPPL